MPDNAKILIIRHAEKPYNGATGLAIPGQARAQAYVIYFQNYIVDSQPIKLHYLFAAADSGKSYRPRLTLEPLSKALGLEIDATYKDKDFQGLANNILHPKYNDANILISWRHETILDLANALGVDSTRLPSQSNWPKSTWPDKVFGWVLQLSYDSSGSLIPEQTLCINQRLMYNDCGQDPSWVSSF